MGLAGDDAGAEYADVLNFLSYLERMYHESVGKPNIWLPEATEDEKQQYAEKQKQRQRLGKKQKGKREKGKEKCSEEEG